MLDGLLGYEQLMLVLGAIFFVVLAALLVLQIMRKQSYASLLFFFAVPFAMMGYPSIQSIQFKDGALTIDRSTQALETNPTDAGLRASLEKQVAGLAGRSTSDPQALARIAKAQFALGNSADAAATLTNALDASPADAQAKELQQRIQLDRDLANLTAQLAAKPDDPATKQKLQEIVAQAGKLKIANPDFLSHLASAQAALGDQSQALALTETALKIKPGLAQAQQLKTQIQAARR